MKLVFASLPPAWVLGLVLVPAVLLLAGFAYRRPKSARASRRVAAALRALLLAGVIALLLGPYLREDRTRTEPAQLVLLYDDSASLQAEDEPGTGNRLARLQALLGSDFLTTLGERYTVRAWKFAERATSAAPDGSGLQAQGEATALGDALLSVLDEYRGRRVPQVVAFSDGRVNLGTPLREAADRLRGEGARVHVVALGSAATAPDLVLERVQVPDVVLAGDVALFTLRLRGNGSDLPEGAVVRLRSEDGRVLDQSYVATPDAAGTNVVLGARLEEAGERRLIAEVEPAPRETSVANNRLELALDVEEVRVRVLYVEERPRWEYHYLMQRLRRSERDVALNCWLADAARGFPQEHSADLAPLARLPLDSEELLANFDLVILGDVDPRQLTGDPLDGQRFLDAVGGFVRRGGGLLVLAGPRHSPVSLVGSALEPLLPVVLGREPEAPDSAFLPLPSDPGRPHPTVLFDSDPETNLSLWQASTPLWWFHPVERLRPGAQAWLVHDRLENAYGPYVIAASGYAPEGWVGWVGTDETWRWRFPGGEMYVDRFWRSALRHLAATRLRGDQGRARLDVDRSVVELGEFLQVEARLLDDSYQPVIEEDGVAVYLEGADQPLVLAPVPDRPGIFRGRVRAAAPGPALLYLPVDGDPQREFLASTRFVVTLPSRETADTSQDDAALVYLAETTDGRKVQLADAAVLLDELDGSERVERLLSSQQRDLPALPILFGLLALASGEWLLRRRLNLS